MRWKASIDGEWERCFAWIPIKIGHFWVWLEHYEYMEISKRGSWRLIDKEERSPIKMRGGTWRGL
jgi:hypothetical protein